MQARGHDGWCWRGGCWKHEGSKGHLPLLDLHAQRLSCAFRADLSDVCPYGATDGSRSTQQPVQGIPHFNSNGEPDASDTWAWRSSVKFSLPLLLWLGAGWVAEELLLALEPAIVCSLGLGADVSNL